ncbi:MAG: HEAT repeat domain-containing protein [Pyrinomonadaceae bacterium]|nr:HEAT repeat domain-containing protein [Phycisphaerales bacterium]
MLMQFIDNGRPSVAAAAVRAIATLDREGREAWFVHLLSDARPGVANAAAGALMACGPAAPVDQLRLIYREGPHAHSRRLALRALLRRHPYDAVVDAIHASVGSELALSNVGSEYIEQIVQGRVSYGPSETQKRAVVSAIVGSSPPLPDELCQRVRDFMGVLIP